MTKLSVNINKIATIRNARGGNNPDLLQVAKDCESFGAQGITIHPRPDERHIRYDDARELKSIVTTELNIEGNPQGKFNDLVLEVVPDQVTLVPDAESAITSDAGWDTVAYFEQLKDITADFKAKGIRVSIFVNPTPKMVESAAKLGADRVELYTGPYANGFLNDQSKSIATYLEAAKVAKECGIGLNAGHDLDLNNLAYFKQQISNLDEVSIGHALICDALYIGLEETIKRYLNCCK